jgi:phosphoglycolate phosphatase
MAYMLRPRYVAAYAYDPRTSDHSIPVEANFPVNLIIFDVDGTLVDSQNIIVEAQCRAFLQHGLEPPTREQALAIVGLSLHEAFTALVGPEGPVAAIAESYRFAFANLRSGGFHEPLFAGIDTVLRKLAARPHTLIGIATGKSQRGVRHLVEREGWHGLFTTIQTADDAPSKPHPAMILQAMAAAGASPERTVMIGDSTYDMEMARAAGTDGIGVSWGYHSPEALVRAGAQNIVGSVVELEAELERMLGPAPVMGSQPGDEAPISKL